MMHIKSDLLSGEGQGGGVEGVGWGGETHGFVGSVHVRVNGIV